MHGLHISVPSHVIAVYIPCSITSYWMHMVTVDPGKLLVTGPSAPFLDRSESPTMGECFIADLWGGGGHKYFRLL